MWSTQTKTCFVFPPVLVSRLFLWGIFPERSLSTLWKTLLKHTAAVEVSTAVVNETILFCSRLFVVLNVPNEFFAMYKPTWYTQQVIILCWGHLEDVGGFVVVGNRTVVVCCTGCTVSCVQICSGPCVISTMLDVTEKFSGVKRGDRKRRPDTTSQV